MLCYVMLLSDLSGLEQHSNAVESQ